MSLHCDQRAIHEPLTTRCHRFHLFDGCCRTASLANEALEAEVKAVYDSKLKELFLYFHQNPELSTMEHKTSARLADELQRWATPCTAMSAARGLLRYLRMARARW